MSEKKKNMTEDTVAKVAEEIIEVKAEEKNTIDEHVELNMEQKVTVRSIAGWTTGFRRIESDGDVTIPPEGTARLTRSEIISQAQNGNRLLTGIDDRGSHATMYIEDETNRIEVDFESKEEKITQQVLTIDLVRKLFAYKTLKTFQDKLKEFVITRAEKYAIIQMIKKERINDFEKIRIVEKHTGFKVY